MRDVMVGETASFLMVAGAQSSLTRLHRQVGDLARSQPGWLLLGLTGTALLLSESARRSHIGALLTRFGSASAEFVLMGAAPIVMAYTEGHARVRAAQVELLAPPSPEQQVVRLLAVEGPLGFRTICTALPDLAEREIKESLAMTPFQRPAGSWALGYWVRPGLRESMDGGWASPST